MIRHRAKRIAKEWIRKRPFSNYGKQHDVIRIGWWIYVTTDGRIKDMEAWDGYGYWTTDRRKIASVLGVTDYYE